MPQPILAVAAADLSPGKEAKFEKFARELFHLVRK